MGTLQLLLHNLYKELCLSNRIWKRNSLCLHTWLYILLDPYAKGDVVEPESDFFATDFLCGCSGSANRDPWYNSSIVVQIEIIGLYQSFNKNFSVVLLNSFLFESS